MLEIIIIIGVVKTFCSVAENKGRSKVAWGFVGALSYYVPILLMSFFLLPLMVDAGLLPIVTQDNYFLVNLFSNLAAGVICCVVAYLILKSLPDANARNAAVVNHGKMQPIDTDDDNPYRSPR